MLGSAREANRLDPWVIVAVTSPIVAPLLLYGFGQLAVWRSRRLAARFVGRAPTDIAAAPLGQVVRLQGRARPRGRSAVHGSFSGREGVYASALAENRALGGLTVLLDRTRLSAAFEVDDGTGVVLVEAEELAVFAPLVPLEGASRRAALDKLGRWLDTEVADSKGLEVAERVVESGEMVTLIGRLVDRQGPAARGVYRTSASTRVRARLRAARGCLPILATPVALAEGEVLGAR